MDGPGRKRRWTGGAASVPLCAAWGLELRWGGIGGVRQGVGGHTAGSHKGSGWSLETPGHPGEDGWKARARGMVPVYPTSQMPPLPGSPPGVLARPWRHAFTRRSGPLGGPGPGGLGGALCSFRVGGWSRAPGPGPPSVNLGLGGHCAQGAGLLETRGLPSCPLHPSQASHSPVLPPAWQRPLPAQPGPHSSLWAPGAQNSSTALAPRLLPWPLAPLEGGPRSVRASLHRGAWSSQSPETLGSPPESRCMIRPSPGGDPSGQTEPEQGSQ